MLRLLGLGIDGPVLARLERKNLFLALADHAQRRALHATGGGARQTRFLPQQRRQIETDEVVQRATRLLGVHQILRDVARLGDGFANRVLGDLVEHHAMHVLAVEHALFLEQLGEMPGNGLALAVRVGRQIEASDFFSALAMA